MKSRTARKRSHLAKMLTIVRGWEYYKRGHRAEMRLLCFQRRNFAESRIQKWMKETLPLLLCFSYDRANAVVTVRHSGDAVKLYLSQARQTYVKKKGE